MSSVGASRVQALVATTAVEQLGHSMQVPLVIRVVSICLHQSYENDLHGNV